MLALLRERDFGLLWLAGLISQLGRQAFELALAVHVYQLTGSTLATGATWGASFLPSVLVGSVAGVFVDRWDRRRVMVVSDLLRGSLLLPVVLVPDNLALLYVLAAGLGTLKLFFTPAENALLPTLAGEERLVQANALNALNNQFGLLAGAFVGGAGYAAVGFSGVLLIIAAAFLTSALLVRLMRHDARVRVPATDGGSGDAGGGRIGAAWQEMRRDWRVGIGVVQGERALRVLFIASVLAGIAEGVFVTLGISPLVLDVLKGSEAQVGWIIAAQGVGGLLAGVLVGWLGHRLTRRALVAGGMLGMGLCDLTMANAHRVAGTGAPAVAVAMGAMTVGGLPLVASNMGPQLVMQHQTEDAVRGRVFGAYASVYGIALLVGFTAGGLLGDVFGLVEVLSVSALLRAVGGVITLLWMPREARRPMVASEAGTR